MATTRNFILHDNVMGGVETTLPAHLIGQGQWRTQHNLRLTPALQQVPHKYQSSTVIGSTDVRWLGMIPSSALGNAKMLALTEDGLYKFGGSRIATLTSDGQYRRWATAIYNRNLYYINDINNLHCYTGAYDFTVTAINARYILFWYDHLILGRPNGLADRFHISDLYSFNSWTPDATNESDFYDVIEWQQTDHPYSGITGMGKLGSTLWIYTPTAIIPFVYVGLPKIFELVESGIVSRTGNTFPWTVVTLNKGHFYYDAVESMFFVFTGAEVVPIGEPVRQYMIDNLSTNQEYASRMYGYVDTTWREIWWVFVSNASTDGKFDKAVVFNWQYKRWFTASVENVQSFSLGTWTTTEISDLTGKINVLSGSIGALGTNAAQIGRVYGSDTGQILQEETDASTPTTVLDADNPVLETGDYHYGDIRTIKENDGMVINAVLNSGASINVSVVGRDFLGTIPSWPVEPNGVWTADLQDAKVDYRTVQGRVLRYKLELVDARLASFAAYSEYILVKKAEK